ncbi:MAG: hypothetical protein AABZ44_00085 [Elusimicrobiota bacterium]
MKRFIAVKTVKQLKKIKKLPIVVVDIGFGQKSNKSCGVAAGKDFFVKLSFACAVCLVSKICAKYGKGVLLVLEAPLSGNFDESGNPIRRPFENNRSGWYHGAGAAVSMGALYFLERMTCKNSNIHLLEAFWTRGNNSITQDDKVATWIHNEIRRSRRRRSEVFNSHGPISKLVNGVPLVAIFKDNKLSSFQHHSR